MNSILYHSITAFVLAASVSGTELVDDPLANKRNSLGNATDESLWCCKADLNGDGLVDMLLAYDHNRNGAAGLMWNTYLAQQSGKYIKSSDIISFRPDAATIVKLEGDRLAGLVAYQPGGAGQGVLLKFVVKGTSIVEQVVADDFEPLGKDAATYSKLFAAKNLVNVLDLSKETGKESSNSSKPNTQDQRLLQQGETEAKALGLSPSVRDTSKPQGAVSNLTLSGNQSKLVGFVVISIILGLLWWLLKNRK